MFTENYNNRLNLNKEAGSLIHSFGLGYSIIDEYGREVNSFEKEKEFNRLIEKFRYRQFLIQKLKLSYNKVFEFKEDNVLFIDNIPIIKSFNTVAFNLTVHFYRFHILQITRLAYLPHFFTH